MLQALYSIAIPPARMAMAYLLDLWVDTLPTRVGAGIHTIPPQNKIHRLQNARVLFPSMTQSSASARRRCICGCRHSRADIIRRNCRKKSFVEADACRLIFCFTIWCRCHLPRWPNMVYIMRVRKAIGVLYIGRATLPVDRRHHIPTRYQRRGSSYDTYMHSLTKNTSSHAAACAPRKHGHHSD